ncbi:MAG: TetR/AcrR family transcriptional regulator [Gemmatimonadaceae bacterium]|nr:TetR/AcrR family transcriptional regulator [Gemmatimonadaceae bacterium]
MPAAKRQDVRASEARERLLQATLRCAARDGGAALSLQAIAEEAAVSKALVLYHYRDKEQLLATAIRWLTARLLEREGKALVQSTASSVLEDYWRWLEEEISEGELRVLIELSQERGDETRRALEESSLQRQARAEQTVARVFQLLDLSPRLPAAMIAASELAFRDGLVLWAWRQPDRSARVSFDVFWLSLLSLAR